MNFIYFFLNRKTFHTLMDQKNHLNYKCFFLNHNRYILNFISQLNFELGILYLIKEKKLSSNLDFYLKKKKIN